MTVYNYVFDVASGETLDGNVGLPEEADVVMFVGSSATKPVVVGSSADCSEITFRSLDANDFCKKVRAFLRSVATEKETLSVCAYFSKEWKLQPEEFIYL